MCNTHTHEYLSHIFVINLLKANVKGIFYVIIQYFPKCIGFRMLFSFALLVNQHADEEMYGAMVLTGRNRSTWRTTSHSAIRFTTNPTHTKLGSNPKNKPNPI